MNKGWIITEEKEHYFIARYYSGQYIDGNPKIPIADCEVFCKWDGCMDYTEFVNGDDSGKEENTFVFHICDQDELVNKLTELRKIRVEKHQEI